MVVRHVCFLYRRHRRKRVQKLRLLSKAFVERRESNMALVAGLLHNYGSLGTTAYFVSYLSR